MHKGSVSAPRRLAALGLALVLLAPEARAQSTGEQTPVVDYNRAERFLRWHVQDLIAGDEVRPQWLADGNRFWYRNKLADGAAEFVLIDPVRNTRSLVFDNAKLAAAMSVANDTAYDPAKLPFRTFEFVEGERVIEFEARRKRFRCDIVSYTCTVGETQPNRVAFVASPDSTWEAFVHEHDLWIRPMAGGDSIRLTTDGEEYWAYGLTRPRPTEMMNPRPRRPQLRWSPDSKKIAVLRTDQRGVEHMHYISYTSQRPRHFSQPYALPGDSVVPVPNLHIIDIESKRNIALELHPTPNQLSLTGSPLDSVWTKDSRKVRFHYLTRGSKSIYLVEADAETGAARILAMDTSKTFVETNPRGRPSWFVSDDGQDVLWWSERDGWAHLYRFDGREGAGAVLAKASPAADGETADEKGAAPRAEPVLKNRITSGPWTVGEVKYVDQKAKQIYFTARGREPGRLLYYQHLYRVNYDGTGLTLLTPEDADHEIEFSPSGRFFVDSYSRIEEPPVTVLRAVPDGRVVRVLEKADISRLEEMGWKPAEVFTVKARDGVTDLYGVMYRPTDFDPNKKYPIIDHIYPGPQVGSVGAWRFKAGDEAFALAELGFIVIQLDHLGTPLRSKAFHDHYYGNFIDNGIPDHVTAIKQLAARHSWIDLDRVGIFGHSGGGFASTDAILRFPDFFKVAVSGAGNHDNRSYNIYWAEKYQGFLVRDSVKGTDNFEASANKTYAKNLQGKLLLMHGDMDDNVHPAMTIQLVDALIKANRDFDLIIAPDRAHGLNEPYFIRRRWDYFVRHLLGAEPPKNYEIVRPEQN